MEKMKKSAAQMEKPVKTEWSPRCVIFTYFQGDISSVVDEHFSRALSNIKKPQELLPLSQSKDMVLSNDDLDMSANEWCFSSEWTKPQPEVSFANGATNCSMNGFEPMAMTQYPQPLTVSPSVEPGQLLHFSSPASTSSPEPEYPCAFYSGHLVSQAEPDGEYQSLLNFPHQERCVAHPQQSAMWENCNSDQATRSMGSPFNQPFNSAHCTKYFPPARGPASVNLASDSLAHEINADLESSDCKPESIVLLTK
ncbi:transcription cofactor vestigial-like protein 1 [Phyllostomus discolor]|uniref:Transcription cofactor vestigial-like protein 1 n=1 Tax=Phyllostomus discolor TaxID=89673 RepID=A0A7E6CZ19_9CHIR|nr:transcription cofactor vestigial-like protein 1 [Phyllostomus discolor]